MRPLYHAVGGGVKAKQKFLWKISLKSYNGAILYYWWKFIKLLIDCLTSGVIVYNFTYPPHPGQILQCTTVEWRLKWMFHYEFSWNVQKNNYLIFKVLLWYRIFSNCKPIFNKKMKAMIENFKCEENHVHVHVHVSCFMHIYINKYIFPSNLLNPTLPYPKPTLKHNLTPPYLTLTYPNLT